MLPPLTTPDIEACLSLWPEVLSVGNESTASFRLSPLRDEVAGHVVGDAVRLQCTGIIYTLLCDLMTSAMTNGVAEIRRSELEPHDISELFCLDLDERFDQVLSLWPESVDVSDGVRRGSGGYFDELSRVYHDADERVSDDDLDSMLTWLLFSRLHEEAMTLFGHGEATVHPRRIAFLEIMRDFYLPLAAG